jgi:hypothetical protein
VDNDKRRKWLCAGDIGAGWHTHLDILVDVLEQQKPKAFWKTHSALEDEYAQRLSL